MRDRFPRWTESPSTIGGCDRGHTHREKPDLTDEVGYSTHTGKIVEATDKGAKNVKVKSHLIHAVYW